MDPVDNSILATDPEPTAVAFGEGQPEYITLPALVYRDGRVLLEWRFTDEERARIARGENFRLWIWRSPQCHACGAPRYFDPVAPEITDEHHG